MNWLQKKIIWEIYTRTILIIPTSKLKNKDELDKDNKRFFPGSRSLYLLNSTSDSDSTDSRLFPTSNKLVDISCTTSLLVSAVTSAIGDGTS